MRSGAFFLALLWLAGSAYAGYRLTERSFAWIDEPNFGLPSDSGLTSTRTIDFGVSVPQALLDQAKDLTPKQMACLQNAARTCLE